MKKLISVGVLALILLSSCAENKTFKKEDGTKFTATPYGWANCDARKIKGVTYEVSAGNVFWSIILCETIAAPVYFTGWAIMEPVNYVEPIKEK